MNTNTPEMTRLVKIAIVTLAILAAFLALEAAGAAKSLNMPNPAENTISVTGTATATSTPDIAAFSFSVSADAADVATAQSSVNAKTAKIVADLKALGIADSDIQTSDYSFNPKYIYTSGICNAGGICKPGKQTQDGYTANQSVNVKVRNIASAPQALAVPGADGATNISGLSFTQDDPQAPVNDARNMAIDNARANAEDLAKHLGVSLVRVVGYSDNSSGGVYPIAYDMKATVATSAASAPTIPTGENSVSATVTVTYEIR